jgi:hypothetical protein
VAATVSLEEWSGAFSILLRLGRHAPGLKWILAPKKMQGVTMDALPETLVSLSFIVVVWDSVDSGRAAAGAPPPA